MLAAAVLGPIVKQPKVHDCFDNETSALMLEMTPILSMVYVNVIICKPIADQRTPFAVH